MILVYPMLTSASVNPTLLPGIIKAVEKYIIIHNTDEVLKTFNTIIPDIAHTALQGAAGAAAMAGIAYAASKLKRQTGKNPVLKVKGKKIELTEASAKHPLLPSGGSQGFAASAKSVGQDAAKAASKDVENLSKNKRSGGITGFEMPKMDAVSLEPTWVQVHTSIGAKLIGVKVVPFKVTSTNGMVNLMMNDMNLKKMDLLSQKFGRTIMRVFFRAMRGIKVPGFDKAVSGDPKNDVLWAKTQYGKNMFICFSQLDLDNDDMFSSPDVVKKLHQLGWASIVVTDDVNKQATFCMKEFGGICSTIPYSFIFSSLGKEHSQVYKDLEDANRSAGPFFRKKSTTRRKMILNK
jgi:hypothetical protein